VYFVHAIKRVPGMRLLKPSWNAALVKKLLPVAPKLNNPQRGDTANRDINLNRFDHE